MVVCSSVKLNCLAFTTRSATVPMSRCKAPTSSLIRVRSDDKYLSSEAPKASLSEKKSNKNAALRSSKERNKNRCLVFFFTFNKITARLPTTLFCSDRQK